MSYTIVRFEYAAPTNPRDGYDARTLTVECEHDGLLTFNAAIGMWEVGEVSLPIDDVRKLYCRIGEWLTKQESGGPTAPETQTAPESPEPKPRT